MKTDNPNANSSSSLTDSLINLSISEIRRAMSRTAKDAASASRSGEIRSDKVEAPDKPQSTPCTGQVREIVDVYGKFIFGATGMDDDLYVE